MIHAVLVGVDKYKDSRINPLSFAKSDATALAELLNTKIHTSELNVELLTDRNATKENVMAAIGDRLPKVIRQGDLALFYFACHGSPEYEGSIEASRYLIMYETKYDYLFSSGINMDTDLKKMLERVDNSANVLCILDSCFSGAGGGRTFESAAYKKARTQRKIGKILLKPLNLGAGRLIISACDDNQVARENFSLKHGVFTYYFLQTLSKKRASNTVSVLTIHDEVTTLVENATKGLQVPIINGRSKNMRFPVLY